MKLIQYTKTRRDIRRVSYNKKHPRPATWLQKNKKTKKQKNQYQSTIATYDSTKSNAGNDSAPCKITQQHVKMSNGSKELMVG